MTPAALLADLTQRGVRFEVDGDRLRCRGKTSVLTPDQTAAIKTNKSALIDLLRAEEAITWRVEAMRKQIPERGAVPFLVALSGVPPSPNVCPSCGEPFTPTGYTPRCHRCTVAAQRALGRPVSASSVAQVEQPEERSSLDLFMAPYPDEVPRAS